MGKKITRIVSAEFVLDNGSVIVWRKNEGKPSYTVIKYKHAHREKWVTTLMLPSIINANYFDIKIKLERA